MNSRKEEKWIENNKYRIIAFLLASISMVLFLFFRKMQYGEDTLFLGGDMLDIYVSAIRSLGHNIWNGDNITYLWDVSLGMSGLPYYLSYGLGGFSNFVFLLFPNGDIYPLLMLVICIKVGITGAAFVIFMEKVMECRGKISVFGALLYAMCGFQIAMGTPNFHWIDIIFMLPLVLTSIVHYIKTGKKVPMIIAYGYLFLAVYYLAYIVGFFSAVFFLVYYFVLYREEKKSLTKVIGKLVGYGFSVICAAGMLAVAFIPTILFLLEHNPPDATMLNELKMSIPAFFSRFLIGMTYEGSEIYPQLYCGLVAIVLTPIFFVSKKIEVRDKIAYGALMLLMTVSCFIYPLYLFWHCFDTPDGWFFRFSFILSFLCVAVSCKALQVTEIGTKKETKKERITALCVMIVYVLLVSYLVLWGKEQMTLTPNAVRISILFAVLWIGVYIAYTKEKYPKISIGLAFFLVISEVVLNGCLVQGNITSKDAYREWNDYSKRVMDELDKDSSFYRVLYTNSFLTNSDSYLGYNGLSDFGTFENYRVRKCLENLGNYTSTRIMEDLDCNPFVRSLMGVKYSVNYVPAGEKAGDNYAKADYEKEEVTLEPHFLGLGFMTGAEVANYELKTNNAYENCNDLSYVLSGQEEPIFSPYTDSELFYESNGIILGQENGRLFLLNQLEGTEVSKITFKVPAGEKPVYMTFYKENPSIVKNNAIIMDIDKVWENGKFGANYMKKMKNAGEYSEIEIYMMNGVTTNVEWFDRIDLYQYNEPAMNAFYEAVKEHALHITEFGNGYVEGVVEVEQAGDILFTSIPYDKGWKLKGENSKAEIIPLLDDTFLGIRFSDSGKHEVALHYEVPGMKNGMIVSLVCFVLFIIVVVVEISGVFTCLKKSQKK